MTQAFVKNNPLLSYFTLAYALTWISALPIIRHSLSQNWHFLGSFGPTISAFFVLYLSEGKEGLHGLINKITKFRLGWGWIAIAVSPLFLLLISLPIGYYISGKWFDFGRFFADKFSSPASAFSWILPLISYGIFEEPGWRGFALPRLQKRFSALKATFILSVFWFLWHLPMFLYRFDFSIGMSIGFYVGLLAGSIIFTFIFNGTKGSVLMTIIWHLLWNIVSTFNTAVLAPIMSTFLMGAAIFVVFKFGGKNLSPDKKFIE